MQMVGVVTVPEEWMGRIKKRILPQWKVCRLEGTYLPWVDITTSGLTSQAYCDRLLKEAKVRINPGPMYGPVSGEGYIRLNIACPRSRLLKALERIARIMW